MMMVSSGSGAYYIYIFNFKVYKKYVFSFIIHIFKPFPLTSAGVAYE